MGAKPQGNRHIRADRGPRRAILGRPDAAIDREFPHRRTAHAAPPGPRTRLDLRFVPADAEPALLVEIDLFFALFYMGIDGPAPAEPAFALDREEQEVAAPALQPTIVPHEEVL